MRPLHNFIHVLKLSFLCRFFLFCILLFTPSLHAKGESITDWIHIYREWQKGDEALVKIQKPFVTIFGGGNVKENDPFYQKAHTLSQNLAKNGFAIITGGNQGIMKAANCGASEVKDQGITSIAIDLPSLPGANECPMEKILVETLFLRKKLMMDHASAFIIFPGGIGTLDELSEIIVLMYTKHLPRVPIYIVGKEYWHPIQTWFEAGVKQGLIREEAMEKVIFTDSMEKIENELLKSKK